MPFPHCGTQLEARNDELGARDHIGQLRSMCVCQNRKIYQILSVFPLMPSIPLFPLFLASSLHLLSQIISLHFTPHQPPCNDYV